MSRRLRRSIAHAVCALVLLGVPATARAQAVATNFDELKFKVQSGDTIYVTDRSGREFTASVVDLSSSVLTVRVSGEPRQLEAAEVRRIRQRLSDPVWLSGLIGFGAGVTLGGLAAAASEGCSYSGGSECAGPPIALGLIGLGVGAGIDAMIKGRKVIYEAPGEPAEAHWHLAPLLSRRAAGARITFAF